MSAAILQQRFCRAQVVAASPAMDIIAVINFDNNLSLYRTFSWEKVLSLQAADFKGYPTLLEFSPNGKVLCIAGGDGLLTALNVETGKLSGALGCDTSYLFTSLSWVQWKSEEWRDISVCGPGSVLSGTRYNEAATKYGVLEPDSGGDDTKLASTTTKANYASLFQGESKQSHLLVSLTSDNSVHGYIFGIFPLFVIRRMEFAAFQKLQWNICQLSLPHSLVLANRSNSNTCEIPLINFLINYHIHCKQSENFVYMFTTLHELSDMLLLFGRKWKEATRAIPAKLSLLQSVLDGYQLEYSPVEFLYSISLLGMWHPAASDNFSNHWNEEGITRLRSAIDSQSRTIIAAFVKKVIPEANKLYLIATELVETCQLLYGNEHEGSGLLQGSLSLLRFTEQLLMKLDDALIEARCCRERILLYLQFISESLSSSRGTEVQKLDLNLLSKISEMLDHRLPRADVAGKNAQAESVTGTHLYAYLQEGLLPEVLVSNVNRSIASRSFSCFASTVTLQNVEDADFVRRTLISQIRATKSSAESLSTMFYSSLSSKLSEDVKFYNEDMSIRIGGFPCSVEGPNCMSHTIATEVCLKLLGNPSGIFTCETNLSVLVFCSRNRNHLYIVVICQPKDLLPKSYYISVAQLPYFGLPCDVLFYNNPKTKSAYVVGLAQVSTESICMFNVPLSDFCFTNSEPDISMEFSLPPIIDFCQITDPSTRNLQVSSQVKSFVNCETRGVLLILEESGRVIILDMEDVESENNDESVEGDVEC